METFDDIDYLASARETLQSLADEKRSLFESDRKLEVAQVQALLAIAQRLDMLADRLTSPAVART
jgi:hypothetical protein